MIYAPISTNALNYFETPHHLNASYLCEMYGLDYYVANSKEDLENELNTFYNSSKKPKLLEIFIKAEQNDIILKEYFKSL